MGVYLFLGWLWGNNLFSTSDRLLKITLTYHLNWFGLVTPPGNLYILKTLLIPIYTLLPSIIFLIAVNVKGSSIFLTDVAFWKWTFHGALLNPNFHYFSIYLTILNNFFLKSLSFYVFVKIDSFEFFDFDLNCIGLFIESDFFYDTFFHLLISFSCHRRIQKNSYKNS